MHNFQPFLIDVLMPIDIAKRVISELTICPLAAEAAARKYPHLASTPSEVWVQANWPAALRRVMCWRGAKLDRRARHYPRHDIWKGRRLPHQRPSDFSFFSVNHPES